MPTIDLWIAVLVVVIAATGILIVGPRLAGIAETLAERTGLGQAVTGALLLGLTTSLPGSVTSVTAAIGGHAELALANGLGGIAVQTAFLAIADLFHRKANLEHASASPSNMFQLTLLMLLLGLTLSAFATPGYVLFGVHPVSILLFIVYIFGMRIARQVHTAPMWKPEHTPETAEEDETSGDRDTRTTARLWLLAIIYGAILTACGIGLTIAATSISSHTGISESFIGAIGTSTLTSLPELVTAVAAVRRGALALAVGDIVGGNSFDTLFAAVSDIAYRDGSIFAAVGNREMFLTVLPLIMSAVLLMGMLRREKRGPAGIGVESIVLLVLYLAGMTVVAFMGNGS